MGISPRQVHLDLQLFASLSARRPNTLEGEHLVLWLGCNKGRSYPFSLISKCQSNIPPLLVHGLDPRYRISRSHHIIASLAAVTIIRFCRSSNPDEHPCTSSRLEDPLYRDVVSNLKHSNGRTWTFFWTLYPGLDALLSEPF